MSLCVGGRPARTAIMLTAIAALIMLTPMLLVLAAVIVFPSVALFLPRLFPPGTL